MIINGVAAKGYWEEGKRLQWIVDEAPRVKWVVEEVNSKDQNTNN